MRAVVVYESMFGNTHVIATNVAEGLRRIHEVTLVPVAKVTPELVAGADLLVVGAPTHMHGLPSAGSRRMAVRAAAKKGSGLTLDPHAGGPGMRAWLTSVSRGTGPALAAVFDTRLGGPAPATGCASHGISRRLRRHGYRLIATPESFLVGPDEVLLDGENIRARRWGTALGVVASDICLPESA